MRKAIVFQSVSGLSVCFPTGELPIEEVARKDVPAGAPYFIVDAADLPPLELQEAWEVDFSSPHGYGANYGNGTEWGVIGYDDEGRASLLRHAMTGEIRHVGEHE